MLFLASRSPQRKAILEQLGIPFEARPVDVEELADGDPVDAARENARRKARALAGELVLGADTVVEVDGAILDKPQDAEQARSHLRRLSGRTHRVVGGLCLRRGDEGERAEVAITEVTFRELDAPLLDWYLTTGEWRDRAGGYAIQGRGAALVRAVDGDYLNVVGLPVATLVELLGWPPEPAARDGSTGTPERA